jgi:mono/diheme cytochrome c family protein
MNVRWMAASTLLCVLALSAAGCRVTPARPGDAAQRPDEVSNVAVLYQQNCAACHGANGKNGVAISLANPVYLAFSGTDVIQKVTARGVRGSLMPAFAKSSGGMLSDDQVAMLARGIEAAWARPGAMRAQSLPGYASSSAGNSSAGQHAFATYCASCHGAEGAGLKLPRNSTGSLVDPAYLALITDQGLRSLIIAGQPEDGMPGWQSDIAGADAKAMTDQEITDIVTWLASHRVSAPGQPYVHP